MKNQQGFTLIEVILFIIISSIMVSTILLSTTTIFRASPSTLNDLIAQKYVTKCLDSTIGERRLGGYASITCPTTTVPFYCVAPTGGTITYSCVLTTINTDANYKTVTAAVGGKGNSTATVLLANY
jgi:type II secretory pathway pseudopilin PulG